MSSVDFYGAQCGRCGYCGGGGGSHSHGLVATALTTTDYQDLMDRGWRRSGSYCYKAIMARTCCPLYTIKCDAINFQLSKSQKKVLKTFQNFVMHDKKPSNEEGNNASGKPLQLKAKTVPNEQQQEKYKNSGSMVKEKK